MPYQEIKLIIDSNMKNVYLVNAAIEALCSMIPFSCNMSFGIKLSVAEAVNNSIIHAYDKEPGHDVEVVFSLYPDKLIIKVCDTGKQMNHEILSDTIKADSFSEDNIEDMPTGGRGILIINKMMDIVTYETNNNKNCFIMTKKIKGKNHEITGE